MDGRLKWIRGSRHAGPDETIGVLEVRNDGGCRAVFAERSEVDGRCHIRLARKAWGTKDAIETRWWSLVLDANHKAYTVRTGSCGNKITREDVPRIVRALAELGLVSPDTMIHVDDDGPPVFPGRTLPQRQAPRN